MKKLMMTAASVALFALSGAAAADQMLAQKNACMSCHGVDKKIVGPAFKEVAKKYADDKTAHDRLVAKVKTGGGKISHVKTELDITCLPKDLPAFIEVDLSQLALGHSIHVADLKLPKGVEAATHGTHTTDAVVATVQVPRGAIEVEAAAEAAPAAAPAAAKAAPAAKEAKK